MIGLGTVFSFIATSVWPFLREWIFKSKSLRSWFSRNVMNIVWFMLIFVMFVVSYNLFHMATDAHRQLREAREQIDDLKQKRAADPRLLAPYKKKIQELAVENRRLVETNMNQTSQIVTYQNWMRACGMDFTTLTADVEAYPTCRSRRPTYQPDRPTTPTRRTPQKPKPKPQLPRPANNDEALKKQVEDLWGR